MRYLQRSNSRRSSGLYLPSLCMSGRFENAPLESAYQRYSHRQRQKSLIVVNCVDVMIKIATIVLVSVAYQQNSHLMAAAAVDCPASNISLLAQCQNGTIVANAVRYPVETVTWTACLIAANVLLCFLAFFWRGFANNYLHWAALATWVIMNLQGIIF